MSVEIAERLGISLPGARYHVSEILSKLGVSTRQEAAQWRAREPVLGVGILGLLSRKLSLKLSWDGILKTTSIVALSSAAVGGALLVAGLLIAGSGGSGDKKISDPANLVGPDGPLVKQHGPYFITPEDYEINLQDYNPSLQARPNPLLEDKLRGSPVAKSVDDAQASSLFPDRLPEGYAVKDADSDGKPSELFLHLVIDGPNGEITMTRERPDEMPVTLTYDSEKESERLSSCGHGFNGAAFVPLGGERDTTGAGSAALKKASARRSRATA